MVNAFFLLLLQVLFTVCKLLNTKTSLCWDVNIDREQKAHLLFTAD